MAGLMQRGQAGVEMRFCSFVLLVVDDVRGCSWRWVFSHISPLFFCVWVQVLGAEHPDTAATYNNMANVYDSQGHNDKALEYYGKALAITEKVGRDRGIWNERSKEDVGESRWRA